MNYTIVNEAINDISWLKHAFFLKNIPNNSGKYIIKDLEHDNIADNIAEIEHNRAIIARELNIQPQNLSILKQTHSNKAVYVDQASNIKAAIEADGQVTNIPNIALAVLTADCVPILLLDRKNKIIGVAHAGWRGAKSGIIHNTIHLMQKKGANLSHIIAIIGPCIHQNSYEVSKEFFHNFIQESKINAQFFISIIGKEDKYKFDLSGYVTHQLASIGIANIFNVNLDTLTNKDKCYSYRRFTLDNSDNYGSLISTILINNDNV